MNSRFPFFVCSVHTKVISSKRDYLTSERLNPIRIRLFMKISYLVACGDINFSNEWKNGKEICIR